MNMLMARFMVVHHVFKKTQFLEMEQEIHVPYIFGGMNPILASHSTCMNQSPG